MNWQARGDSLNKLVFQMLNYEGNATFWGYFIENFGNYLQSLFPFSEIVMPPF